MAVAAVPFPAAMSWQAWQLVLLLALLVYLVHRAALHCLHRWALRRLQRRTHRWLRSSVASSVHDALLPLLPAALLASAYTADARLCAAQSLHIEWPLTSCLRSITVHMQQPLVDITLRPADDAAADEHTAAGKQSTESSATAASASSRPIVISSSQAVLLRWFRVTILATDIRCHISAPDVTVDLQVAAVKANVGWSKLGDGGMECQLRVDDCTARLKHPAAVNQQITFHPPLLHSKLFTATAVLPFHRTASSLLHRRASQPSSPSSAASLLSSAVSSPPLSSSSTYYTYTPAMHALQVELAWDGLKGDARLDQLCCLIACLHLAADALRGRSGTQRRTQHIRDAPLSSTVSSSALSVHPAPPPIVLQAPSKVSSTALSPAGAMHLHQHSHSGPGAHSHSSPCDCV